MTKEIFNNLGDSELIHRILEESCSECFDVLHKRYYRKVLDKCYSMVKDRLTAEELAEDIFSRVYEKLPSFRQKSSFSSWLYSITYNRCIDFLREKKHLHYPDWNRENEIPEIIAEEEDLSREITYEKLMQVMERIHPEEKALLVMKYQDNMSIKQISGALRISEAAAKMRLKRAKTRVLYLYTREYLN
jgi:RNA polymerase sigma factor (sigma-70 family)